MSFFQSIISLYYNYFTFKGRATRSEYWWANLFYQFAYSILLWIDLVLEIYYLSGLFAAMTFFPLISVTVRRLHDVSRSGGWFWINLVPLFGIIYFLYLLMKKGTPEENAYGKYNDYKSKWILIIYIIFTVIWASVMIIFNNPFII